MWHVRRGRRASALLINVRFGRVFFLAPVGGALRAMGGSQATVDHDCFFLNITLVCISYNNKIACEMKCVTGSLACVGSRTSPAACMWHTIGIVRRCLWRERGGGGCGGRRQAERRHDTYVRDVVACTLYRVHAKKRLVVLRVVCRAEVKAHGKTDRCDSLVHIIMQPAALLRN